MKFDTFPLLVNGFHFEINTDCTDERRRERVVGVAEEEGRLTDAAVADDKQLEHIVKVLVHSIRLGGRRHLV